VRGITPRPDFQFGVESDSGASLAPTIHGETTLDIRFDLLAASRIAAPFAVKHHEHVVSGTNEWPQEGVTSLAHAWVALWMNRDLITDSPDSESFRPAQDSFQGKLHVFVGNKNKQIEMPAGRRGRH
jgi:hypothetical protein